MAVSQGKVAAAVKEMNGIYHKLELDVMQASELYESVETAFKYQFPAVVIHPGLASDILYARNRIGGRFKIIVPVDWPKGMASGNDKFRGLSADALKAADGFEIYLSNRPGGNGVKTLIEFIGTHLGKHIEIRFALGTYGRKADGKTRDSEMIQSICQELLHVQAPAMVRLDTRSKLDKSNLGVLELVREIGKIIKVPVKVSGNITGARCMASCPTIARFAIDLNQARTIVRELRQQPDQLRDILADPPTELQDADMPVM